MRLGPAQRLGRTSDAAPHIRLTFRFHSPEARARNAMPRRAQGAALSPRFPMQATQANVTPQGDVELLDLARESSRKLKDAIAVRVVGQETVIELMLIALLARGHALLVGVPGLAKTLLVASLAEALDLSF